MEKNVVQEMQTGNCWIHDQRKNIKGFEGAEWALILGMHVSADICKVWTVW